MQTTASGMFGMITDPVRLYKSREDLLDIAPVVWSENLEEVESTINDVLYDLDKAMDKLSTSLDDYYDALYEDQEAGLDHAETDAGIRLAREQIILAWGKAQKKLSTIAALLDINGNEAYQEALNT